MSSRLPTQVKVFASRTQLAMNHFRMVEIVHANHRSAPPICVRDTKEQLSHEHFFFHSLK